MKFDKWEFKVDHPAYKAPIGNIVLAINPKLPHTAEVHAEFYEWSKGLYEYWLDWWGDFLEYLKQRGVTKVISMADPEDKKLIKFFKMFYFEVDYLETEVGNCMLAQLEV